MDIKAFFLYTIAVIGGFIFLNSVRYIDKYATKINEKIGIFWQLIGFPIVFYGMHKATYEIYLENYKDDLGWNMHSYLFLFCLTCFILYTY